MNFYLNLLISITEFLGIILKKKRKLVHLAPLMGPDELASGARLTSHAPICSYKHYTGTAQQLELRDQVHNLKNKSNGIWLVLQ